MTESEWRDFLHALSRLVLLEDVQQSVGDRLFSPADHRRGYIGLPGATEDQLVAAEQRLGIALPPSYRTFLRVSNGWPMMHAAQPGALWGTEQIVWIRDYDPRNIKSWGEISPNWDGSVSPDLSPTQHLYYRDVEPDTGEYRGAYVQNLLAISDHGDACDLLLLPNVVDDDGEWECWMIASWYPGAARWQSFEKWIVAEYMDLQQQRSEDENT